MPIATALMPSPRAACSPGSWNAWTRDCQTRRAGSRQARFHSGRVQPESDSHTMPRSACSFWTESSRGAACLICSEGARKVARRWPRQGKKGARSVCVLRLRPQGLDGPQSILDAGRARPMPIMGKYYMYYGNDFVPPRPLGRMMRGADAQ